MENARNIGISASRNKLLKTARAQYVAIMDHDDISLPGRLEKQALYLDASPDTGVVGCNIRKIGTNIVSDFPIDNKSVKSALPDGCVIAHTAAMIRKSVLTDNDISWEADFSPCEDYMLWGRLAGKRCFTICRKYWSNIVLILKIHRTGETKKWPNRQSGYNT